jgi:SMC interacting uncharacterized protein involved in chromosome segregation
MSINVKKYTKDQMAKMVEDAQESAKTAAAYEATWRNQVKNLESQVSALKQRNTVLTESIDQMNGEAINKANEIANLKADADALRNKLADTEAALGRANAELTYSVAEKNALRNDVTKMTDRAAFELGRANYAESHPWRNLWAWVKRKLSRE